MHEPNKKATTQIKCERANDPPQGQREKTRRKSICSELKATAFGCEAPANVQLQQSRTDYLESADWHGIFVQVKAQGC